VVPSGAADSGKGLGSKVTAARQNVRSCPSLIVSSPKSIKSLHCCPTKRLFLLRNSRMTFAQLTHRGSLRDIEVCLRAQKDKLYHRGIRSNVSRSAVADAKERRDWRI